MRQCEFKRCYDPETGRFEKKHVYGESVSDFAKTIASTLFGIA